MLRITRGASGVCPALPLFAEQTLGAPGFRWIWRIAAAIRQALSRNISDSLMMRTTRGASGVCPALPLFAEQTLGAPCRRIWRIAAASMPE